MKSKDFSVIIVVAIVSAVISILLSNTIISSEENTRQNAEAVEVITPDFTRPDTTYFNKDSVNPAKEIQIGKDPDSNPFKGR